ncbi:WbqC-like protein [Clostridium botulinum]|uniref:WbqC family protein n=1 Tax=Clostridium botulinum TaxID=1491 RepID=UPI0005972E11|nr:WbqC family protein [Clostridium botulinum]KIL08043.1 WbqC-like protein [Clostridium botulinum]MBY6933616.1 WbqC family protein [Clostridium botulinum]NFL83033.1 WbqC family protein [Clostridium botulinum]NFN10473.1 WbqC family protein [Clostridium botulinum]NFN80056.1 WbqC family protein [Clostridium botulinum]
MKLGIMQPYFFPYIGYFQLMNYVDKYVVYDDVNFIKGGWINRNRILSTNKLEWQFFNVRMKGASSTKLINEITVSDDKIYRRKLLKTIENTYKNAPYFKETFKVIEEILACDEENLARFLFNSFKILAKYLDITTELILSSDLEKDNALRGKDKVIDICKILNADIYVNSIGGKELYNVENFAIKDIELQFLETLKIKYDQFNNNFVENLSIIDVMMFNSMNDIKNMIKEFHIIRG